MRFSFITDPAAAIDPPCANGCEWCECDMCTCKDCGETLDHDSECWSCDKGLEENPE